MEDVVLRLHATPASSSGPASPVGPYLYKLDAVNNCFVRLREAPNAASLSIEKPKAGSLDFGLHLRVYDNLNAGMAIALGHP
jgi:hypothetical protein